MLRYEALRQLTHERRLERERAAAAERLALQARGRRHRHARRRALAGGLGAMQQSAERGAELCAWDE
jgi:hypothetical protein